jgi:hypothetical protein
MKTGDVPQDQDPTFEGSTKICYAVGENGQFTSVKTSGWTVEAEAKDRAWKTIETDLEQTRERVCRDEASGLEYYMKLRLMDSRLLAANMGLFHWRVKRHLRPRRFAKLNDKMMARYAQCLDVSALELRQFHGDEQ